MTEERVHVDDPHDDDDLDDVDWRAEAETLSVRVRELERKLIDLQSERRDPVAYLETRLSRIRNRHGDVSDTYTVGIPLWSIEGMLALYHDRGPTIESVTDILEAAAADRNAQHLLAIRAALYALKGNRPS